MPFIMARLHSHRPLLAMQNRTLCSILVEGGEKSGVHQLAVSLLPVVTF